MNKEIDILRQISTNDTISQREISQSTGIALGTVNLLLQKMIKTGLVKIERLNARTIKYILTPKGIAEKTKRTYHYILHTYQWINDTKKVIKETLEQLSKEGKKIYLVGKKDEVYGLVEAVVKEEGIKVEYAEKWERQIEKNEGIVCWSIEEKEKMGQKGIECVNLLEVL